MKSADCMIRRFLCIAGAAMLWGCATTPPPRVPDFTTLQSLGTVQLDPVNRFLVITGFVNQVDGGIELFACGRGGKTHESILVLYANPADMQAGLLLLKLKHGPPMPGLGMGPPVGDAVSIDVHWTMDGQSHVRSAESMILDNRTGRAVKHGAWIFNGSEFENGFFKANAEESLIASYWDPWAIINLKSEVGNDDERLVVNRKTVPPLHTPIQLIISPRNL